MRSRSILAFVLAGCGAAAPAPSDATDADAAPRIVEVATGATIEFDALVDRLADARIVYVGERHDRAEDHAMQRRILEALYARDPDLAVGFEMFQRPYQSALDAYVAGELEEAAMLEQTEWDDRWGFDFAMYAPLIRLGRDRGVPLVALNARSEVTRAIAREGLDALEPADREALPELDRGVAAHRARVADALRAHHPVDDEALERFYTAQLVWDETMAETVAARGGRMVVFAGVMHVARDAIPARAARRGAAPFRIVVAADALEDAPPADFVWVRPPAP